MIRALSDALQIPADLLLREPESVPYGNHADLEEVSLPLLTRSGWFTDQEMAGLTTSDIVRRYLKPARGPLYLKHTVTYGATPATNKTNLRLWVSRVRELAQNSRRDRATWREGTLSEEFLNYVARLS